MSIRTLNNIFRPKRIALVGVPTDPNSVGGMTLSNLVGGGFRGVVYPVNPKHEAVLGIPCYPNVKSLPKIPDLAIISTNAKLVPQLVEECGEAGILGIVIQSAGFKEIGKEGKKLEDELKQIIKKYKGMRVIGPNCLGFIVPGLNLNASFACSMPQKGHVAFISQSGALGTAVLDWAQEEKIGFSYFVSIGNAMDVNFGDLIDFFGQDANTKSIILYVESIINANKFMTAARAFARKKPIIVYKAGRYPESAQAAASHTGAMASEDNIYDALFRRAGIARVYDIGNIFDFTDLISRKRIPKGPNLGIVTNAGGPGVMATDSLIHNKGQLVSLSDETMDKLNGFLPNYWSHGNPVDVLGDATPERFAEATRIVLDDPNVNAVLVILTPQAMTDPTETARAVSKLSEDHSKPIMAAWLGGKRMLDGISIFNNAGVAVYPTPEQAIKAFMTLVGYSRNLEALFETPKDVPVRFTYDRHKLREEFNQKMRTKGKVLSENDSKSFLETYGITTASPHIATNEREAIKIAEELGYPVVMKILSADIPHKTAAGGVILNVGSEKDVKISYRTIIRNVEDYKPDAKIEGVTVQTMVNSKNGVEMILGIKKDPIFGTVIMAGMGGVGAELYEDKSLGFPPLNERLARLMLEDLKIYPLLKGYRGAKPKNVDKLIETMIRLSYLAADYPEIEELDINPILVSEKEVIALDAHVIIDQKLIENPVPKYSHLVLHPYPEKYVTSNRLNDGTHVILRPIKPEDEP